MTPTPDNLPDDIDALRVALAAERLARREIRDGHRQRQEQPAAVGHPQPSGGMERAAYGEEAKPAPKKRVRRVYDLDLRRERHVSVGTGGITTPCRSTASIGGTRNGHSGRN